MSTHPFLPLYVDDFEAATAHLSPEEDGIYNRLMRLCWRTPGCSLPADPALIARKIRLSADDFARIAEPLLAEFFVVVRGRYVQRRLKREYDAITRKKTVRKLAGKKGGDAKARNVKDNIASIATVLPAHTRASPEPYPEPDRKEETDANASVRAVAFAKPNGFAMFWEDYPAKVGKRAAEAAYGRAVKRLGGPDPPGVIFAGVERAKLSRKWREGFVPNPATWLNQDRWSDETDERADPRHDPNDGPDSRRANTESRRRAWAEVIAERDGSDPGEGVGPGGDERGEGGLPPRPRLAFASDRP